MADKKKHIWKGPTGYNPILGYVENGKPVPMIEKLSDSIYETFKLFLGEEKEKVNEQSDDGESDNRTKKSSNKRK